MSYPNTIQALVIEDDERAKETYQSIFETMADEFGGLPFRPAPPCFAFSHDEAAGYLATSKIFQIVILDFRLPERQGLPAIEGIDLGLNLLARCVDRDHFPIPALLVISGHIGSTDQARMQETLRQRFHYGRQFAKGDPGLIENEIRVACRESIRYCSVGIHVRDAGEKQFPTITPREEDLLRRSVLQQHGAIGLDLDWGSAKPGITSSGGRSKPCTKVLLGRYLLDEGRGATRPKFFKLLPGSEAASVIESVRQVEHKLTHIKLNGTITSKSAALIVTEKVGANDARPNSLPDFFTQARPVQAADVARQIAEQVGRLGDVLQESRPLKSILWPGHDIQGIREQWDRLDGPGIQGKMGAETNPLSLFSELASRADKIRLR